MGITHGRDAMIQFIKKLVKHGQITAIDMYNHNPCTYSNRHHNQYMNSKSDLHPAWVSHGYLDGYMDTNLPQDIQWSDCITCGAWMSEWLWEDYLYTGNKTTLREVLIPVYYGISSFFMGHMFSLPGDRDKDGDVLYTGPSHSPENSYTVIKEGNISSTHVLSLRYAIYTQLRVCVIIYIYIYMLITVYIV